jgi:hypothetical protein
MIREVKLVLIAAGIVTVLGIVAGVLVLNPEESASSEVSFKAVEPVDVFQVVISNEHGTFDIAFTGEGYQVDDIPAELVDVEELIDLLTYAGKVYALRTAATEPQDLARYGLADPNARVEIIYLDESRLTLTIGNVEPVSKQTYVRVGDDPAVYLMKSERMNGFQLPKKAYVEDQVTPKLALSSPLSAVLDATFRGGQLEEPVTVEAVVPEDPETVRTAMSFGTATHIVRGNGTYELDQTYGVEMLGALLGITAHDIVGYELTQEEIHEFGFDQPTMQVAFDLQNGVDAEVERYNLAVLRKGDAYYMTRNDNGVIYAVQKPAFLDLDYDKLPVRWFLSPLLIDVQAIDLTTGGQAYEFVITGGAQDEIAVTCNGKPLDIERFRDLFRLLASAAHDGRLLDNVELEGGPLLRLTYDYVDGLKEPDVMALYPGEARRVYVSVNGVTELAMQETYLDRVQEALDILWTEQPIKTDW